MVAGQAGAVEESIGHITFAADSWFTADKAVWYILAGCHTLTSIDSVVGSTLGAVVDFCAYITVGDVA